MGQFVETIDGISQACTYLNFPVVSGNVSFYNETKNRAIAPTPTIGGVGLIKDLNKISVNKMASSIRFSSRYSPNGTNVNFFNKISDKKFEIRTYERGVEDETLSCGTGATAVAIAVHAMGLTTESEIIIQTRGGESVSYTHLRAHET